MAREKILVVEDDEDILELILFHLAREGFRAEAAGSGEEALRKARAERPDVVLLDLMLPGLNGLEVCRALKADARTAGAAVVMVTAKGEEGDIVAGLELGADDYVTKPFSPAVLMARVRAVLRRRKREEKAPAEIRVHELVIGPARREAAVGGRVLELTATEFALLSFLASHPGWVFTRGQIIDAVKGQDYAVTERAVDVQVLGLRRKLGEAGKYIETVRGVGYRFRE
jgi:two-component system phosphate regulon response regulator PhoB